MIYQLTLPQRERALQMILRTFIAFCEQEFQVSLYRYQIRVAMALLRSLFVEPVDVYVKIARQAGKTEVLTLLYKFLIIYFIHFTGKPLMSAIASPKGEQAKTDIDRIKKSIRVLRLRWNLEDRENNQATIRAYRLEQLCAEIYRFSLAPTTDNESKTLNFLAIEESHKADHQKRRDQLDPMLASTGGPTAHFGVGCPVMSDYKRGCDGHLPGIRVIVPADEVCRDRREVFEKTGDPSHLAYERKFLSDVAKHGRQNPEIRRNFYLEDTVEEGNFIARDRLMSRARASDALVTLDTLFAGFDWARRSDNTWGAITNDQDDLVDWLKVPHVPYKQQVEILKEWLYRERELRTAQQLTRFRYVDRIQAVRADSTGGSGDAPQRDADGRGGLTNGRREPVYLHEAVEERSLPPFRDPAVQGLGQGLQLPRSPRSGPGVRGADVCAAEGICGGWGVFVRTPPSNSGWKGRCSGCDGYESLRWQGWQNRRNPLRLMIVGSEEAKLLARSPFAAYSKTLSAPIE